MVTLSWRSDEDVYTIHGPWLTTSKPHSRTAHRPRGPGNCGLGTRRTIHHYLSVMAVSIGLNNPFAFDRWTFTCRLSFADGPWKWYIYSARPPNYGHQRWKKYQIDQVRDYWFFKIFVAIEHESRANSLVPQFATSLNVQEKPRNFGVSDMTDNHSESLRWSFLDSFEPTLYISTVVCQIRSEVDGWRRPG